MYKTEVLFARYACDKDQNLVHLARSVPKPGIQCALATIMKRL